MKKACGFYVSNVHLVTMIFPYLKEQLGKKLKIETFFEQNLNENINIFLSNLLINEDEKKQILNINWNNNKIKKYGIIEKNFKNLFHENNEVIFLVGGNKNF